MHPLPPCGSLLRHPAARLQWRQPEDKDGTEQARLARRLRELGGRLLLKEYRPRDEHATIMEEIAAIRINLLGPLHDAYGDFVQRLTDRQGTILPDFEYLYDRRGKLDGKLFSEDTP